ncbi:MAG: hypothetical protein M3Y60_13775, partial [Bacteroidota bacterium]|nr:hypothetical protein [Bacteroidota bacterium]
SDLVFLVGVDADQNIWAGTERGISRLRLNADWELIEHRFYATPETNQEAFSLEGKKFFGTTEGLYEYDAANDEVVENISPLHFTGIAHDNIDHVDYDSGFFHLPVNLRLPYDKNWIEFSFKKILKSELSPASYRYRLENFDREWSAPSSVDNVRYSNLPPGAYTFRVRADNGVDGLHDQELSYEFVVVPPFYVTTIFRLMLMVAAVLFVAGIMYWRIRARVNRVLARERMRNEEQAKLRKEMAQDFHDEMGNQLARIINYTGQLQLRVKPQDEKSQLYQKIEQTAKTLFFGTRDFIWSMNPDNENTSDVFGHIKYFGENMFNDSNIAFSGDSKLFYSLPLPFGFSREITLIFKEAFTNIYKYSQSKEVNFLLHEDQGVIEFVVIDDGIGFPAGERAAGHGLSNMHNRAAKINSDLSIYSEAGCGTKISLRLSNLKPPPYVNNRLQKADSHY